MEMEKRRLGRTNLDVGVIGLGTEHINVDVQNVDAMVALGIDWGMNYIDFLFNDMCMLHMENIEAYWHGFESAINRYRDDLILCLHWGFLYEQPIDLCQKYFEKTINRLGNGYADIAMISMVDSLDMWDNWATKALNRLKTYRRSGHIGYIGFANHNPKIARLAVESDLVDVLMFPVNLYQHPKDPERQVLLDLCATLDIGVIAMKPFYGGLLMQKEGQPTGITAIQCLNYVLSKPITAVVPGFNNVDEMKESLKFISAREEEKSYNLLVEDMQLWLKGQCVRCNHCLPCPEEVPIPLIIYYLNYVKYHCPEHMQSYFRNLYLDLPVHASDCIACEVCLDRCSFEVDIIEKMSRAVEVFSI